MGCESAQSLCVLGDPYDILCVGNIECMLECAAAEAVKWVTNHFPFYPAGSAE